MNLDTTHIPASHHEVASPPDVTSTGNIRAAWAAIALAIVLLLWTGMVINNAFVAGVKFATPSMSRAVGMDVGRTLFVAFNKVELLCCAITFCLLFLGRPFHRIPRIVGVLLLLVWIIVGLQTVYLLPMLVERALLFMQGQPLPPSPLHRLYSSSELIKIISLLTLGINVIRQLREPTKS
jgi:hypothetical protein